jgi:hypothetical protein
MHWVGWEEITKPKQEGGLGLYSSRGRSLTLLAKLNCAFHFHIKRTSLWAQVLEKKYLYSQRISPIVGSRMPCSQTWKALNSVQQRGEVGDWVLGSESNLSFCEGKWIYQGPSRFLVEGTQSHPGFGVQLQCH